MAASPLCGGHLGTPSAQSDMAIEKRFQVFVSSTYADLQEERQEIMQALLELDCIPAGMELFPAANEDQWSLIKRVIDDCDYYIVIVGGRYGSVGPDGLSYTEMEYRYALENSKPVIGFVHRDPGSIPSNRTETDPKLKLRLDEFRVLVQQKMVRYWDTPAELGSQVSRSIVKLIKSNPAVGWVRADLVPDERAADEILRLRKRIEEVENELHAMSTAAPAGTEELAQAEEAFTVHYSFLVRPPNQHWGGDKQEAFCNLTWNAIFGAISPLMIQEAHEDSLRTALDNYLELVQAGALRRTYPELAQAELTRFSVADVDFHTIKIQFRALGLITKSTKARSVKDTGTYWTLTPYGDTVMTRLRAIKRDPERPDSLPADSERSTS